MCTVFNLENYEGWHFHLTSDEIKILPNSHNAKDGPLYPLMKREPIFKWPL